MSSIKSGNDLNKIEEGFPLDRNMNDMRILYDKLYEQYNCQNEEDFIKISATKRKGLSHKPMGKGYLSVNQNIPVLHTELNSLKMMQELNYTLNARAAYGGRIFRGQGKKRTKAQKMAKKKAKFEFRDYP